MYTTLTKINNRPRPFEKYSAPELWTGRHTSKKMLEFHLNPNIDVSSRRETFIEQSTNWIATHFGLGIETRIADFGCGPGLYTTKLAKTGAKVTGIDFSHSSIRHAQETARQHGMDIQYVESNYLEYESTQKFDLILMIMCDYCALSPWQRKVMLNKFRTMLTPGGSILLDVYSLKAFEKRQEVATYEHNLLDGFWAPVDYFGFLNIFKYEPEKVVLDKYTIFKRSNMFVVYNWLQYFDPESLAAEFMSNGLCVEKYLADVCGNPFDPESNEFAIIARKSEEAVSPIYPLDRRE